MPGPQIRSMNGVPVATLVHPGASSGPPSVVRRPGQGGLRAYWPVVNATVVAALLVAAGLAVAVQSLKRAEAAKVPPAATKASAPQIAPADPALESLPQDRSRPSNLKKVLAKQPLVQNAQANHEVSEAVSFDLSAPLVETLIGDPAPPAACADGGCENHGTSVDFVSSPRQAAQKALGQNKLVFVLHVSGNFEDPQFT